MTADQGELSAVLDEEINKLPDKYRRPIVLCYLEGLTQDVAARRLRWKAGVLRGRLDRCAINYAADWLDGASPLRQHWPPPNCCRHPAQAAVPAALVTTTFDAAVRYLTVCKVAGAIATLVEPVRLAGVFRTQTSPARAAFASVLVVTGALALAALTQLGNQGENGVPAATQLMSGPVAPPKTKQVPPADRTIDFRIVDRSTGKPLPGVRLTVKVVADQTVDRTTDETGAMTLDYPLPRSRMMHVNTSKDGFTPMLVWIRHPRFDDEFPAIYTQSMAPTAPIGGVVQDEDGRPVAGAKVSPTIFFNSNDPPPGREEIRLADSYPTDTDGRRTCPSMPSGYNPARLRRFGFITLISSHSESSVATCSRQSDPRAPSFSSVGSLSRAEWSTATITQFMERESLRGSRTVGIGFAGGQYRSRRPVSPGTLACRRECSYRPGQGARSRLDQARFASRTGSC